MVLPVRTLIAFIFPFTTLQETKGFGDPLHKEVELYVPASAEFDHPAGNAIKIFRLLGKVTVPGFIVNLYYAIDETTVAFLVKVHDIYLAVILTATVLASIIDEVLS